MAEAKKAKRPTPMANESKPDKALTLLKRAHTILAGIGGKDAPIWEVIAGRVQTTIKHIERHK